jgi:hypothetical protein
MIKTEIEMYEKRIYAKKTTQKRDATVASMKCIIAQTGYKY